MRVAPALASLALFALTACSGGYDKLHRLDTGQVGPDEFSVVPAQPLEIPEQLSLPQPTPGGGNRADPAPQADAVAALGGNAAVAFAGGIPAGDTPLLAYAGRNGTDPAIRSVLADEDAALRQRASFGGSFNLLGRDRYYPAYANQALDAYAELARFRAMGAQVPSAPPATD